MFTPPFTLFYESRHFLVMFLHTFLFFLIFLSIYCYMNNNVINDFSNFDFKSLSEFLKSLSPLELSTIGCVLGLIMIPTLTSDEQNSLGNFFELVGQVLLTSAAQQSLLEPSLSTKEFEKFTNSNNQNLSCIINQINLLKNKLKTNE